MRTRYWSCSKFADWLRGTPKPRSETGSGWKRWENTAKTAHPFRYWLADDGLDYLQTAVNYIPDKLYSAKYYINNRFVTRTHSLIAHPQDIKPGNWCDVGNRFLPCMFNELVNFVEVELAWWNIAWTEDGRKKYNAPFYASGWFRWRTWRCPQSGIDNLDWQRHLKINEDWVSKDDPKFNQPTSQAIAAQEILDLYFWWTTVRPARPDPHDVSGWSAICEKSRKDDGSAFSLLDHDDETPEERAAIRASLDKSSEIEAAYEKEDEEMLIRLIKIRNSLWT